MDVAGLVFYGSDLTHNYFLPVEAEEGSLVLDQKAPSIVRVLTIGLDPNGYPRQAVLTSEIVILRPSAEVVKGSVTIYEREKIHRLIVQDKEL